MIQGPAVISYCLGSVDNRTVGFKDLVMTKASKILDNVDVSVIGLKSLSNRVTEMSGMSRASKHENTCILRRKSSRCQR